MNRTSLLAMILLLAVLLPAVAWSWGEREPAHPLEAEAARLLVKSSEHSQRGELDMARSLLLRANELLMQAHQQRPQPPIAAQPALAARPAPPNPDRAHRLDLLRAELAHAEQRGDERQLAQLRAQLHELAEASRREQAAHSGGSHGPHAHHPPHPGPPHHPPHHGPHQELEHRMHHLQAAVEHLRQANEPGLAEQAMRELMETRERLARAHHHPGQVGIPPHEIHQQLDQLSREVRQLRELILRIAADHEEEDEEEDRREAERREEERRETERREEERREED